jgi:hypothetical protein
MLGIYPQADSVDAWRGPAADESNLLIPAFEMLGLKAKAAWIMKLRLNEHITLRDAMSLGPHPLSRVLVGIYSITPSSLFPMSWATSCRTFPLPTKQFGNGCVPKSRDYYRGLHLQSHYFCAANLNEMY